MKCTTVDNHAPRGHGIGEDDFFTILDFADKIFYGKNRKAAKRSIRSAILI